MKRDIIEKTKTITRREEVYRCEFPGCNFSHSGRWTVNDHEAEHYVSKEEFIGDTRFLYFDDEKTAKKWMSFRVSFDTIGQIDWQCSGWYGLDVNDGYDDERVGSLEPLDKIMSGWVEDTKHIYTWLVKAGRLK